MRARRFLGSIGLVAIGLVLGVVLTLAATQGDEDDEARPDEDTAPDAAELYDALRDATERTQHATYRVTLAASPEATSSIELWQRDGQVRQDTVTEGAHSGNGTVAVLVLDDRSAVCRKPLAGSFTCQVLEEEPTTIRLQLTDLMADLKDQQVTARDDVALGGQDVRCFTLQLPDMSELCLTDDGVLAGITGRWGSLELDERTDDVADEVFELPVAPIDGPGEAPAELPGE